jgi:hypothetical protein
MPKLSNRLAHLETIKKAQDDAPHYYLNFAGREARRVEANGQLFEREADESSEHFEDRIKAVCGNVPFTIVRGVYSEEEWLSMVAEHYRKHPVGQPWQD